MADQLRKHAVYWLGLSLAAFQLIVPVWLSLFDMQVRAVHVMLAVITTLLAVPMLRGRASGGALALNMLLMIPVVTANALVFVNWQDIITYTGQAETLDHLLGAALMVLVLEAARRVAGWALPLCVVFMFAYVFVGPFMPGVWAHPGFPLTHVIETIYYSSAGIYGSLTGVSATFIAIFIIFGSLLKITGGGETFMDLALLIAGRFKGGPAKVGVVASALFGMISGSAVANVSVTGNYTIPLMRRLGYDRNFAGGVEAMSSAGGGITPPVMGITAFIMADMLGIPYLDIIGYATIPCILFYVGIIAGVHFKAQREGLAPLPRSELPRARDVLTWPRLTPLFVPIAILLGFLFNGYSLIFSGFSACLAVIVLYLLSDLSRKGIVDRLRRIIDALSDGGVSVAQIAPILVAVAIFAGLLGLTGVAPKISGLILSMGGENLFALLLLAAVIPLLLGAPFPVSATYIIFATLIAPALVRLGLDLVAVHMFLLYWATLASVTPPTCTACVVAANIAEGNWFKTSLVGMQLGAVAFFVPFFFVNNPALIARGTMAEIVVYGISGLVGAVFLASGIFGYLRHAISPALRLANGAAGLMLLTPNQVLSLAGAALAAGSVVVEWVIMKKATDRAVS